MLYFKGTMEKARKRRICMKRIRLIFALTLSLLALLALGACTPIEFEPIDPDKNYTITFDTNGGSEVESQTVKRNEKITLPDTPTKEGYDFVGWYSGNILWNFDEYTVRKDTSLVAKWQIKTYTVTFTGGYETDDGSPVEYESVSVIYGGKISNMPKKPVRENHVFKGWTVNGSDLDADAPIYGDTVIEAKWNKLCTVTFDTAGVIDIDPVSVEAGNPVLTPDVSDVIGYRLVDWYAHGEVWDFNEPIADDVTITAIWQQVCWVSFNTNGGEVMEPYQVDAGTVIDTPPIPYYSGHYFMGWYSISEDGFTLREHDFSKPVTKNLRLEAKYVVRDTSIIYDDQTLVKIILPDDYRLAHGQYITGLKNAIDGHLIYDSETVSSSEHELVGKYREIVVGRSDREISVKAYEALEAMRKNDRELRYLIYFNRVYIARGVPEEMSVCIAYDEDEDGLAMRLAIETFIEKYLSKDTLSWSRTGAFNKTVFDPADYAEPAAFAGEWVLISYGKEEL